MRSERQRSTGQHDGGAVAVEAALVSILLMTLLLGIIESSLLFKDWISVSAAARAGARMGASEPRVKSFGPDSANQVTNALSDLNRANLQEVWVYKSDATGFRPATCATNCLKYTWNATTSSLVPSSGVWDFSSQNACPGDPATRDSLGVYVQYQHASVSGLLFNKATVSESTVMLLEPWNIDVHCAPGF